LLKRGNNLEERHEYRYNHKWGEITPLMALCLHTPDKLHKATVLPSGPEIIRHIIEVGELDINTAVPNHDFDAGITALMVAVKEYMEPAFRSRLGHKSNTSFSDLKSKIKLLISLGARIDAPIPEACSLSLALGKKDDSDMFFRPDAVLLLLDHATAQNVDQNLIARVAYTTWKDIYQSKVLYDAEDGHKDVLKAAFRALRRMSPLKDPGKALFAMMLDKSIQKDDAETVSLMLKLPGFISHKEFVKIARDACHSRKNSKIAAMIIEKHMDILSEVYQKE